MLVSNKLTEIKSILRQNTILTEVTQQSSLRIETLAAEMMTSSPVQFVELNTTLRNTILLMLEKKISSVLITGSDGEVSGDVQTIGAGCSHDGNFC